MLCVVPHCLQEPVFSTPRGRLGSLASQTLSKFSSGEQGSGLSSLESPSLSFGAQGRGGSGMPGVVLLVAVPIQGQPFFLAVQAVALRSPQAKAGGWVGRLSSRRAARTTSSCGAGAILGSLSTRAVPGPELGLQWRHRSLEKTSAEASGCPPAHAGYSWQSRSPRSCSFLLVAIGHGNLKVPFGPDSGFLSLIDRAAHISFG